MTSTMRPIETIYNGYRFRSRLEARWAVFFDEADLKYQYETEGFSFLDGTKYLPDFYLPDFDLYVEVKPENAFKITNAENGVEFSKDGKKYANIASQLLLNNKRYLIVFGDPQDAIVKGLAGKDDGGLSNALFYKGECKIHFHKSNDTDFRVECDGKEVSCAQCNNYIVPCCGSILGCLYFEDSLSLVTENSFSSEDFRIISVDEIEPMQEFVKRIKENLEPNPLSQMMREGFEKFQAAALKSRQARFEYGQTPKQ